MDGFQFLNLHSDLTHGIHENKEFYKIKTVTSFICNINKHLHTFWTVQWM